MELVLTGDMLSAQEATEAGLVARVVPAGTELEEALQMASKIASFSAPVVQLAKASHAVAGHVSGHARGAASRF